MVILQFNKLIRNKWLWGVFAVAISAFFAFDFLIADLRDDPRELAGGDAGKLGGEPVKASYFQSIAEDVRGIGRNRDWQRKNADVNREAWQTLATLAVAKRNGIEATVAEVQDAIRADRSFQVNGRFSFSLYQRLLRENSILPERFEEFLKRRITVQRVADAMLESAAWVTPAEIDRAVADMTDELTVKVADFVQTPEEAAKITIDDAGVRKWYDANTNSLALPERVRVRLVRYDADDADLLAKMTVTDDELHDYFDANGEKFTKVDTNGVSVAKTFDEAKAEIERECRLIAAVQCLETNLTRRVYARQEGGKSAGSRLDAMAKEDGKKVATSDWFAPDGSPAPGFASPVGSICPGAEAFAEAVAQLDDSSEDLRYGVVLSKNAAWLIEKAETSPAHVPTFEEAKEIIRPRALRAAKEDAFKALVEGYAAKGTNELFKAAKSVSTNCTFSVANMGSASFANPYQVAMAARKLAKGEVSDFVRTGPNSGVVVVCENRVSADAAAQSLMRLQVRDQLAMLQRRQLPEGWQKWNLERIGFEPGEGASVTEVEDEE